MINTIVYLFFAFVSFGQSEEPSKSKLVYRPLEKVKVDQFFDYYKNKEGGMDDVTMIAAPKGRSKFSNLHPKFSQSYKGIEVYGSTYSLHLKNGFVHYTTGKLYNDIDTDVTPTISEDVAKSNATQHVLRKLSKESDKPLGHDKMKSDIKGLVVIDVSYPASSGKYTLAYKIEVKSLMKAVKYEVIASAKNNTIIFDQNLIKHGNANGIGKTFYYGNQNIVTDSLAPNRFVLRDLSRGKGITTFTNASGSSNELIVNTNNVWDNDEVNDLVAIDAHYTTAAFYDMMVEHFGYSGVDGEGGSMNPVIHVGGEDDYLNAYWDGENAYFGHGNCHNGPLTTLSVVAHEFTHGVTQYNSNLIYNEESGALNESLSDIFGKSLEYFVDKENFSWDLGPEFALSKFASTFRSMSDPNMQGNPKRYKGLFWEDGADVHYNSGVLNHWFYLLVEGVTGDSEGIPYAVNKVDIDEVLQVLFLCQTSYLTPSSDYPAMYEFTMLACEDLYGAGSPQYASMQEAWKAVGLPVETNTEDILDLQLSTENFYEVTCIADDYYPLKIVIRNVGTIPVEAGEVMEIEIEGELKSFELAVTLKPSESVDFVVDDVVYLNETNIDFYSLGLFFLDENASNNDASFIINNFAASVPEIQILGTQVVNTECGSTNVNLLTYITNNSCQEVPANTEIILKIYDGSNLVKEIQEITKSPIFAGEYYPISFTMEPQDYFYDVELICAIDSDVSNNMDVLYISENNTVNGVFAFNFDDDEFNNTFELSDDLRNTNYKNETYLVATGNFFGSAPCPDPDRNFKDLNSGSVNVATSCIDLTSFTNPRISFDMIQLRSGIYDFFEDPLVSAQTSMMKLSYYNDDQSVSTFIYDQPEDILTNHSFYLPQGFVGKLELSFYNSSGDGYFSPFDTDGVDAILIDNLILEDVNNTTNADLSNFKLQPNPVSDFLTLYTDPSHVTLAQIFNAQGQLMKNISLSIMGNEHKISVADLNSGYYIMKINSIKGSSVVLPFVKI